ncbi:uncharacterized protein LOC126815022 [Patella vulgata]|uniref:uncharacterized protein LOC126815022 n=1 Tax=Patella vulgata TaxID=6465 RepID=UPI00217FC283|nr:uncharacterized protein LOC126815022 [Patella vulgata]
MDEPKKEEPKKGKPNIEMESYERRFFAIIRRGQTENILRYLHNIHIDTVNEEGETPLIIAAKGCNYVLLKLLTEQGAKLNKTDKEGRTALHYASGHGNFDSINLLLANGANIDIKDEEGRTPLHYAVKGDHIKSVDLLVFCGADGTLPDYNGVTPMSLCSDSKMSSLMLDSVKTVNAIKQGYIKIDRNVLKSDETKDLRNLNCKISTPVTFSSDDVYLLSRRVRPEFRRHVLRPKELLISDTCQFRVSGSAIENDMTISVPMYCRPQPHEEIHMITNMQPMAGEDNIERDVADAESGDFVQCSVKVDLRLVDSLLLVTLPKKEYLAMSTKGGKVKSTIDTYVTFEVEKDTFSTDGALVHQILPKPMISKEEFPNLIACTNFHDVTHSSSEQPKNKVKMTLPLPNGYTSGSKEYKLYVMLRQEGDNGYDADKWEVLTDSPTVTQNKIQADIPHFCAVAARQSSPESNRNLRGETEQLYQKALRAECKAVFLGLLTKLNNRGEAELLAECTNSPNYKSRIEDHVSDNYVDQEPSFTKPFTTYSGHKFLLEVKGQLEIDEKIQQSLEFHPKRTKENKKCFAIIPTNEDFECRGQLEIIDLQPQENKYGLTTGETIDRIHLHLKPRENKNEDHRKKKYEGFLSDRLIKHITNKLEKEQFDKLLVDIHKSTAITEPREQVLREWRDIAINREDGGLPALIKGLGDLEQTELVGDILEQLKDWKKDYIKTRVPFTIWLSDIDPDGFSKIKQGTKKPMSDEFLRSLAVEICKSDEDTSELFQNLKMEENQILNITENRLYAGKKKIKVQIYLLLKLFRDLNYSRQSESFQNLHKELYELRHKFPKADERCLGMAEDWIQSNNNYSDLRDTLKPYIEAHRSKERDYNGLERIIPTPE